METVLVLVPVALVVKRNQSAESAMMSELIVRGRRERAQVIGCAK